MDHSSHTSPRRDLEDPLLTDEEVGELLRVPRSTVRWWRHTGRLPFVSLGPRTPRTRMSAVIGLLEARETTRR